MSDAPAHRTASLALKQYYVAVSHFDVKLATLIDLLLALQANGPFAMAIICSSRDSLDAVVCGLLQVGKTSVSCLHSDMGSSEREATLAAFMERAARQGLGVSKPSTSARNPAGMAMDELQHERYAAGSARGGGEGLQSGADGKVEADQPAEDDPVVVEVLVATDVCLRGLDGKGIGPLGLPLLVNYDLPSRKEIYSRRIAVVLGGQQGWKNASSPATKAAPGDRLAVHFVAAGQLPEFRLVEAMAGGSSIHEMPVHISELSLARG